MNPALHEKAKCDDRAGCTGPGCRINTGKTKRLRNFARPHYNKAKPEGYCPADHPDYVRHPGKRS